MPSHRDSSAWDRAGRCRHRPRHQSRRGGYLWRGQLRLWDNEILMGWYAADDQAVRSKGTLYLVVHPHGHQMRGRWTGLSYDGPIQTGLAAIARTEDAAASLLDELTKATA